ncbi:DUF4430 domain-containing protein [Paenibacillus paeoniae]|uniref:DUF4430 domain-containing protein n=2 Tax=Paenibacillus paeoniae TaxID=2292705 RepID=A0A371P618_9BACL|nr:DUF4430 domain-containing protein [Paenibacillus paeoniae]
MSNKKFLFGICVVLALVIAFFLGPRYEVVPLTPEQAAHVISEEESVATPSASAEATAPEDTDSERIPDREQSTQLEQATEVPGEETDNGQQEKEALPSEAPAPSAPMEQPASGSPEETSNPEATSKPSLQPSATVKPAATPKPTTAPRPSEESKDRYLTDPIPSGKPKPVEWQDVTIDKDKELTITLSVTAKTILNNMKLFNEKKLEVLPEDGVIYPSQKVTFYEGESVFDVLLREMKRNKIHMEFVMTPIYNSNYVEGINNIYEFDCGELSGWMYKVNEWFPNYGASRYVLKDGDVVDWVYTCDLGRDIGGGFVASGGEK